MAEGFDGLPDDDIWNIEYEDLQFTKELARGSFGKVFKGLYLGVEVAIKQILRHDDPAYMKYIEREISVLKSIRHPFIVGFCGVCLHQSGLYIVTEFVDGGDVRSLLKSGNVSWNKRVQVANDLAKAVYYLHSKKVIHRDLKSKNLLIGTDNRVRLCDFGFARTSDFKAARAMTICGTPGFVAPEIMIGNDYDASCDVFSYGNVLAELITLMRPGKDFWLRVADNEYDMDLDEIKKYAGKGCPPKLLALCLHCCEYKPTKRPDFSSILKTMREIENELPKEKPETRPPLPTRQPGEPPSPSSPPVQHLSTSPGPKREILSSHRNSNRLVPFGEESYVQCIMSQKIPLTPGEITISEKHLSKMINRAVSPEFTDYEYLQDLLQFYPCFSDPRTLLKNLTQKYIENGRYEQTPNNTANPAKDKDKQSQISNIRILVFVKSWVEKYAEDFEDAGMSEFITAFDNASKQYRPQQTETKEPFSIAATLTRSKARTARSMSNVRLRRDGPKKVIDANQLLSISPNDIARQITMINSSSYKTIQSREFIKETYKRRSDSSIKALRDQLRELSRLVCNAVVSSSDKEIRSRIVEKFIDVAGNLITLKNFTGFFGIMQGLNHPCVERLVQTFSNMRPQYTEKFKGFQQIVSTQDHYKNYKQKQDQAIAPSVPHLEVYLEEISFIDSQNPDISKGGIINFGKHRKMARIIRQLLRYQDSSYMDITPLDPIQELLINSQLEDDEALQKRSLIVEPPTTFG